MICVMNGLDGRAFLGGAMKVKVIKSEKIYEVVETVVIGNYTYFIVQDERGLFVPVSIDSVEAVKKKVGKRSV